MSVVDHPGLAEPHGQRSEVDRHRRHGDLADQGRGAARRHAGGRDRQDQGLGQADAALHGRHVRRQGSVAPGRRADQVSCTATPSTPRPSPAGKTDFATFVPSVYNADTLGIRPDLVGREITTWADLISPDFKGKTAIQNIPTNGIMDAMMALESAGEMKYGDKGNPTQDELSKTIARADRAEEGRPFPRAVEHVRREREPDGGGRGGHPVDVVAGGHRGQVSRREMHLPAAQGRLSRLGQRPGADGASRRHASATRPTSTSTGTIPAGSAASSPSRATTAPMSRRPRRR